MQVSKTIPYRPSSEPALKKMQELVNNSNTQLKPDIPEQQLDISDNIVISSVDIEDSLLKELFPDTYLTMGRPQDINQVRRAFVDHAGRKLDENNGDLKQLKSIAHDLVLDSSQAHSRVKDMFASFGALTKDTEHLLLQSEAYIFDDIDSLANTHAEKFNQDIVDLPGLMAPKFQFEVTTQEGDKVEISFGYSGNWSLVSHRSANLEMQVDGDISAQEQAALDALYEEVGQYISQAWSSDNKSFDLTAIDLSKFDSEVLSSFDIDTEFHLGSSTFFYQVDHDKGEQRLATSMILGGELLQYDLDITTGLYGGDKGKEGVLGTLIDTLEKMDTGLRMDSQINSFMVDTFAAMLNVKPAKEEREDGLTIKLFNKAMKVMETQIEGLNLAQLNTLPDYKFSLELSQLGRNAAHESKIDMAQTTKMWVDGLGKHAKQKQSFDVHMSRSEWSENTLRGKHTEWNLSKEQQIKATLNSLDELKHHKVTGKHDEEVIKTWLDQDYITQITKQQLNRTYSQQLDVLDATAKLVTEEKDKYFQGAYEKIKEDGPTRTKGESRYEREYRQVLNFKRDE